MTRTWAIVMSTAPRPGGTEYLSETLRSLGVSGVPREDVQVIPTGVRTRNENGVACLQAGVVTGAEWILHLEDDLRVCQDLLGAVDRWVCDHAEAQGVTLYSFYAPYARFQSRAIDGGWSYPLDLFKGCQAFAIRATHAQEAIDALTPTLATWGSPAGFDRLLARWLRTCGGKILGSAPCFVQHVGTQTSLWYPHTHQSPTFRGETWTYTGHP